MSFRGLKHEREEKRKAKAERKRKNKFANLYGEVSQIDPTGGEQQNGSPRQAQ
jgi:hypothetical protein